MRGGLDYSIQLFLTSFRHVVATSWEVPKRQNTCEAPLCGDDQESAIEMTRVVLLNSDKKTHKAQDRVIVTLAQISLRKRAEQRRKMVRQELRNNGRTKGF